MIELYVEQPHIRLKMMREALAISRSDFAKLLNVNYRRYARWENKDIKIPVDVLKIMVKFGLNPCYLFGEPQITVNNIPFENVKKTIIRELFNRSKSND